MFEEFEPTAVPPGHLLTACPGHRIVNLSSGREFVAVEMIAGCVYSATLRDYPGAPGAARYPRRLAVYDPHGEFIAGATTAVPTPGTDNLCIFTPIRSGTHYIEARGCSFRLGSPDAYARQTDVLHPPDPEDLHEARTRATDLGDISAIHEALFPIAHFHGRGERLAFVRFMLARPALVSFGLRLQPMSAQLVLENAELAAVCGRTHAGADGEWLTARLAPGTYHARVRRPRCGGQPFVLRYKVSDAPGDAVRELRAHSRQRHDRAAGDQSGNGADAPTGPVSETTARVSLGTVVRPETAGRGVRHQLVGGNEAGLFELDAVTGELFFTGTEAEMPLGKSEFVLTVRSHDGERFEDVFDSVCATRDNTRPKLVDTAQGLRISLGRIAGPAPPGAGITYRLTGGNEAGRFELDETTGELFFNGDAEELEEAENGSELTVRVEARRH